MHIEGNVISYEDVSAVLKKVVAELPWNEVDKELTKAYRELQKEVRIRGFRPGKVPRPMLERQYGEAVKTDVAKELAGHFLEHYLKEKDVTPVSIPTVEEFNYEDGKHLKFTAKFEVKPEIELGEYRGIEITSRPVIVKDEEISAEIERIRQANAQLQPIEDRVTPITGDIVFFDMAELKDDKEIKKQPLTAELGEGRINPVMESRLLSAKTGEPFELELSGGKGAPDGSPKRFRACITSIKKKVLPELNDEFAKDLGEYANLSALTEEVKNRLTKALENRARDESEEELLKEIISKNPFPVPESVVQRQLDQYIENFKKAMGNSGISEDIMKSEFSSRALFAVQRALILDSIAKREGMAIEEDDVEVELKRIADDAKKNVAFIRAHYEKENLMEGLKYSLKEKKVLDYLLKEAKLVEKPVEKIEEPKAEIPEEKKEEEK